MFKALKYLFIAKLFKRAKFYFILLGGSLVTLLFFSFMMNDMLHVSQGINSYLLLGVKWSGVLALLMSTLYSSLKIINIATSPFSNSSKKVAPSKNESVVDRKKEHILNKEHLLTKSEQILQKYTKD